jgi:AraC-like DNA-binding protein
LAELRNLFASLVVPHSLIADAGIIFTRETVLTKSHMFYFTEYYQFYGQFLRCGTLSMDDWISYLIANRPIVPMLHYESSQDGSYDAITFAARWPGPSSAEGNLVFAVMPVSRILSLIADATIINRATIRIYDDSENLIFNSTRNSSGNIHTITDQSSVALLRFEIDIPDILVKEKLRRTRAFIFLFALVGSIFTLALSFLFAYRISAPVRQLFARIDTTRNIKTEYEKYSSQKQTSIFKGPGSFFFSLAESISAVDTRLEDSLQTIAVQTQLIRNHIFETALNYGIYDSEKFSEFLSVFSDFPKQYQLGALRYTLPKGFTIQKSTVSRVELMHRVKTNFNFLYWQGIVGNDIVLLLPLSGKQDDWYTRIQLARNELVRRTDLPLNFFLSSVFNDPRDLSRAWQQIHFVHTISGMSGMINMEEIPNSTARGIQLPMNITMLETIYSALCNANAAAAKAILKECAKALPATEDPLIASHICSLLSNLINQLKLENPSTLFDIYIPVYEPGSQDVFFNCWFPQCFRDIADRIESHREKSINQFGRQVVAFINEHLYDPDLYITMVTDHFNISKPTLQKLVKNISDQTFLAYVEKHRLNKALEMLSTQSYSIAKIASSCGFSNTNSFYKAFKRNYGYPPSDIQSHSGH